MSYLSRIGSSWRISIFLFLVVFDFGASRLGYAQFGSSGCGCICANGFAQVGHVNSSGHSTGVGCKPNACESSKCYCQRLASNGATIRPGEPVFEGFCGPPSTPTPTPTPFVCRCDPPPSTFCSGSGMSYRQTKFCADSCTLLPLMQACEYTCRLAPHGAAFEVWEASALVGTEGSCGKEYMPCERF